MQIKEATITFSRTYNLGNYESRRVEVTLVGDFVGPEPYGPEEGSEQYHKFIDELAKRTLEAFKEAERLAP